MEASRGRGGAVPSPAPADIEAEGEQIHSDRISDDIRCLECTTHHEIVAYPQFCCMRCFRCKKRACAKDGPTQNVMHRMPHLCQQALLNRPCASGSPPSITESILSSMSTSRRQKTAVFKPVKRRRRRRRVHSSRCMCSSCMEEHESETVGLAQYILVAAQQRRDWQQEHRQKGLPPQPSYEPPWTLLPLPNFVVLASDKLCDVMGWC